MRNYSHLLSLDCVNAFEKWIIYIEHADRIFFFVWLNSELLQWNKLANVTAVQACTC